MVGSKLFNPNHLGLVTVIATLFVAAVVHGEKAIVFDSENASNIDLQCKDSSSNPWTIETDEKVSPSKKIFKLSSDSEGCFKSKRPVTLNSESKLIIKFLSDSAPDENEKIVVGLEPLEGSCPGNDCLWEVTKDPQFKKGEWVVAEHKFPLKSTNNYNVYLKAGKSKNKFALESLTIPNELTGSLQGVHEQQIGYANGTSNSAVAIRDFGKSLLFTAASVLTLNNLFN